MLNIIARVLTIGAITIVSAYMPSRAEDRGVQASAISTVSTAAA
jgi:hypothetical protein